MLLRIVDICNSVFISVFIMLSELLWCLKLKKIWWDLIKLASLAFGLKFEIVDKLKFWYGIRYVYPFENNLSSFLLKTFRCKCA